MIIFKCDNVIIDEELLNEYLDIKDNLFTKDDNYLSSLGFKDIVKAYLANDEDEDISKFLLDFIKYRLLPTKSNEHKLLAEDELYLYSLARICNINSELELVYTDKNEKIINVLNLANEYMFNDNSAFGISKNLFDINYDDRVVDYEFYLLKILSKNNHNPIEFLKQLADLCDTTSINFLAKNLLNTHNLTVEYQEDKINNNVKMICALSLIASCLPIDQAIIDLTEEFNEKYAGIIFNDRAQKLINDIKLNLIFVYYLSNDGRNFYILANEMENTLSTSAFADYSICSLQYYKIIEIELKNQLIKKAANNLNPESLYNYLQEKIKLPTLKYVDQTFLDRLELGKIHYLLLDYADNLANSFKGLDDDIRKFYINIYYTCPFTKMMEYIINITHSDLLALYRNPAAHTNPLSYNACKESKRLMEVLMLCMTFNFNPVADKNGVYHFKYMPNFDIINKVLPEYRQFKFKK